MLQRFAICFASVYNLFAWRLSLPSLLENFRCRDTSPESNPEVAGSNPERSAKNTKIFKILFSFLSRCAATVYVAGGEVGGIWRRSSDEVTVGQNGDVAENER